jgi:hypothetical protein
MSAASRSADLSRAVTIRAASLGALCGCLAALVLLAGTPAAQAAPCGVGVSGMPGSGCNAGATGLKVAGAISGVHQPAAPVAPATPIVPCVPGASGAGLAGCGAGATRTTIPGFPGSLQHLLPGGREVRADPCNSGVHREGMPDCNVNAAGAVVQGVMTFMQVLAPLRPH